jgi:hypothetical protein
MGLWSSKTVPMLMVSALMVVTSHRASAQGFTSNAEAPREGEEVKGDTKVVDIDEVERGFFVSLDAGPAYYMPLGGDGFVNLNPTGVTPATRFGVRVGYDVLNNIAVDAFVLGTFQSGVLNLDDLRDGKLTGDLAHIVPGVGARFAFVTTERVFAYGRVGVGYALWLPSELAGATGSIHADAALGIEYYTKLRHVSVGVEADVQALLLPMAFGVHVYPTFKYTF